MVDFNIDTSSYPKAAPIQQQNPLDTISKLQGIQRQQIGIDRDKLELYNKHWDTIQHVLGNLANKPDLSSKDFVNEYQKMVKAGAMTPEQFAQEVSSLPNMVTLQRDYPNATPQQHEIIQQQKLHQLAEQHLINGAERNAQINWYARGGGIEGPTIDNGQVQQQTIYKRGNVLPIGPGYQKQIPPATPTFDENGRPQFYGSQGQPIQTVPPPRPNLPTTGPVNPARNVEGRPNNLTGPETPTFNDRFNATTPKGPPAGQSPLFEEGKKQYSEDIANASNSLQALKPAQQALKLMDPEVIKGLTGTGPIAEKATKILSALQGVGLLNASEPVAARQELVKKLAQYVGNNPIGQRSDAAQTLKEAGSPNPNVQVLPALIELTRDAIAYDRSNAAKALAFGNRSDYNNYLPHKGSFPNSIDERVFKLDTMSDKERNEFLDKIEKESKQNRDKFKKSYQLAKQLGMM